LKSINVDIYINNKLLIKYEQLYSKCTFEAFGTKLKRTVDAQED